MVVKRQHVPSGALEVYRQAQAWASFHGEPPSWSQPPLLISHHKASTVLLACPWLLLDQQSVSLKGITSQ
ncbi:hypothetical protein DPEC_G00265250 [Dallia pectoralis]|uniref:Uncharacterized protein n=1 Tax=Dallia pectoralis TaxID=75939 RepID=A0ACC2FSN8_DALPE|nr:hypothetical protein DPEC_G00265250 [Dallia pectoralis]